MSEILQRTVADIQQLASDRGLKLVLPMADELLLDLDYLIGSNYPIRVWETLASNGIQITSVLETLSKGGNTHKYIKLDRALDETTRIALQTMLGSDHVKEVLSLLRIMNGSDPESAIALFETEDQYIKVLAWRAKLKAK